jgi:putative FmdB family regulatory protein
MPTYEYECRNCGERFDVRRSFQDNDKDLKCLKCGALNPRRVLSLFSGLTGRGCPPSSHG